MAKLNSSQRMLIVQRLACFDSPTTVKKFMQSECGIEISRQHIEAHDPTKRQGRNLAKRYKELFSATREEFLKDAEGIALSHKVYRLRALQRMLDQAEEVGNIVLAKDILEQAAKESGDFFTNRRHHQVSGPKGGPIQHESKVTTLDPSKLSTSALRELSRAQREHQQTGSHTKQKSGDKK